MLASLFSEPKINYESLKEENDLLKGDYESLKEDYESLKEHCDSLQKETHPLLGSLLYERDDGVKLFSPSIRRISRNIKPWKWNRGLDIDHVSKLESIIIDKKCLEGNMDILDDGDELCIVNGQHRLEAYLRILDKDVHFDQNVLVYVHPVSSFDSEEANDIFTSTNNIKNVQMKDNPKQKIQNVCRRFQSEFPKGITQNNSGKANLHRLDIKQIYNILQYNDFCNDPNNNEDVIYQKLFDLNLEESKKGFKDFFPRIRNKESKSYKQKMKLFNGASDSGFYLGMSSETQLSIKIQTYFH